MSNDDQFFIDQSRSDYIQYLYYMNPNFILNYHHEIIAKQLMRTLTESNLRILIQAPPRHSKSFMVSENFPAFRIGKLPDKYMILASYGQELASDFGRKVRNYVDSDEHSCLFPNVSLSKDSKSKSRFNTNKGGSYFAVGRGGSITGRGGDLIIIDDLIKNHKEAESALIRKQCVDWYKSALYTRLMPGGSIIVMGTRWHEEDLMGYLINHDHEDWEIVNLPAIDNKGNALWSEWFSIEDLMRFKKTLGTRMFESLYQQNPAPAEGNIIKREWIKFYKLLPNRFDEIIQSWDMAFKGSDTSDFVVGSVYGRYRGQYYLIDQVRDRMNFPSTINSFISFSAKHPGVLAKLVEAKANGQAVIDTLNEKIPGIIAVEPKDSKESRLNSVAPFYEAGNVLYPHPDIAEFDIHGHIEEVVGFPFAKNDDRVDAETQALSRLSVDSSMMNIYNNIENYLLV